MKSFILCRGHFSDAFVADIKAAAAPSGLHCIETRHPVNASTQPPNVLLVLSGSPANQKTRSVTVRFGGGSAKGSFDVALAELPVIFKNLAGEVLGV